MASTKISALPGASTLTGAETIPLVQGGVTKKVTTDQFLTKDASGNVGIGTASPVSKVHVEQVSYTTPGLTFSAAAETGRKYQLSMVTGSNFALTDTAAAVQRLVVDASGNLGLGVTPSAWWGGMKVLQVSNAHLYGMSGQIGIGANASFDGSSWVYQSNDYAMRYAMVSGESRWYTAPSGTAGNPISFTQAMTLDASGNLLVGASSAAERLTVGDTSSTSSGLCLRTTKTDFLIQPSATDGGGVNIAVGWVAGGQGPLKFSLNGTERARIDASGNLGLGVTPSAWGSAFDVVQMGAGTALTNPSSITQTWLSSNAFYDTGWKYMHSAESSYYQQSLGSHSWYTAPSGTAGNAISFTQAMTLDANGNLGLGVTPSGNFTLQTQVNYGSGFKGFSLGGFRGGASGGGYPWVGYNIRPTSTAEAYVYDVGDVVSAIKFADGISFYVAPSGTAGNPISFTQVMALNASGVLTLTPTTSQAALFNYSGGAYTTWQHSGTSLGDIGSGNQVIGGGSSADFAISSRAGNLVFGINGAERARIDASGNLLVGTTSTGINDANCFTHNVTAGWFGISHVLGTASGTEYINFGLGGVVKGSITQNGTTGVNYNTSSDARLKENIAAADNGSALIDGLQVRKFDWKADGSHQRFGFVAQELDAVYPEAVSKPADPDEMMGVDYSKLVPLLVQEIQSLRARLAAAGI